MSSGKLNIFDLKNDADFNAKVLETYHYQYFNNPVYRKFSDLLKKSPENVIDISQIPFLPVEFFKNFDVVCGSNAPEVVFTSSGTSGMTPSRHLVTDLKVYEESFLKGFQYFYGNPHEYNILALLPSYLERQGSSLIYMAEKLISMSLQPHNGFFLNNIEELAEILTRLKEENRKTLLLGVTFALMDFAEKYPMDLAGVIVMETGGMKGRGKEPVREELHRLFQKQWNLSSTHSEYGMTELLSQAYSKGEGVFYCPPWMKVILRDSTDPLNNNPEIQNGAINIIDLANINSCSFIATQDLGKIRPDGGFEVLGRFDNSDVRGCNLMVSQ